VNGQKKIENEVAINSHFQLANRFLCAYLANGFLFLFPRTVFENKNSEVLFSIVFSLELLSKYKIVVN
jgi:hypothetical protein